MERTATRLPIAQEIAGLVLKNVLYRGKGVRLSLNYFTSWRHEAPLSSKPKDQQHFFDAVFLSAEGVFRRIHSLKQVLLGPETATALIRISFLPAWIVVILWTIDRLRRARSSATPQST